MFKDQALGLAVLHQIGEIVKGFQLSLHLKAVHEKDTDLFFFCPDQVGIGILQIILFGQIRASLLKPDVEVIGNPDGDKRAGGQLIQLFIVTKVETNEKLEETEDVFRKHKGSARADIPFRDVKVKLSFSQHQMGRNPGKDPQFRRSPTDRGRNDKTVAGEVEFGQNLRHNGQFKTSEAPGTAYGRTEIGAGCRVLQIPVERNSHLQSEGGKRKNEHQDTQYRVFLHNNPPEEK